MEHIKAFVFDLDGVIVDTARYHFASWKSLAHELGFTIPEALNHQLKGRGRMESLELVLEHAPHPIEDIDLDSLATTKNTIYQEYIRNLTDDELLPGVQEFLTASRNAGLGIAIGSGSKNARTILERIGADNMFDAICDGNDITRSKPDPEIFECACRKLEVKPAHTVVFEDAATGITAAAACGAIPVGIGDPEILSEAALVLPGFTGMTPRGILDQLKLVV